MEKETNQFVQIPYSLLRDRILTDQDKLTLGIILSFIKNNKECYIGNDKLGEILGISKNAASKRLLRLEKIGCISIRYEYKENSKHIEKRYLTLLSLTPRISPDRLRVSPDRLWVSPDRIGGISSQTTGYLLTDDRVSPKVGGIIQPILYNVLDKELDKLSNNLLNKEKLELTEFEKTNLIKSLKEIVAPEEAKEKVELLIKGGKDCLTIKNRELILANKKYFNKGSLLQKVIAQLE